MATDPRAILRRLDAMRSQRTRHETTWRDCFRYTFPLRGHGFGSETIDSTTAQERRAEMLDSTATDSVRILASSIMSGLTPANARWFELDVPGASDEEKRWLDDAAGIIWRYIHTAQFDAAAYEGMIDLAAAGWCALYVDEDRKRGGLSFTLWPLGGLYIGQSTPHGRADIVYRSYSMTALQAVTEFGEDEVSERIRKDAKDRPMERHEFVHAIEPRESYTGEGKRSVNMPIRSCHLEVQGPRIVRERGYQEMPVIVPRWMLVPDSAYGQGPVFDALPDVKMLNELRRMHLAHAEIDIAPPMIAVSDGVLNARTIKLGPRKIIVANSVDSMKPLLSGANWQLAYQEQEQLQRAIRRTLMADQLQPQNGPAMTATEVHVRVGLIRQLLGPVYGRLQAEYLQPLIERCFGLCWRAQVLGEPPQSLAGRDFTVRYLSPMARSQRLEDVGAMERLLGQVQAIAQVKPEVVDLIDADAMVRESSDALGTPPSVVRTEKQVAAYRDAQRQDREAKQQQAQQAAIVEQATGAAIQQATAAA
jgi:hypothetical protein